MKKNDKYEQLTHSFNIPVMCIKSDAKVEILTNPKNSNSMSFLLPVSIINQINFNGQEKLEGVISCEAIFHIKLNKKKVFEVVKEEDNDFSLTLTKNDWTIDNQSISDPTSDSEFYKLNNGDPVFDAVNHYLDSALANGELDEIITRNDGEPWSRDEAKMALEIYLRTAHTGEYSDQMDMIKAYINNGYLSRSFPSVRMMVHGLCHFDEDHENTGFSNLGKIFKEVWDEYHAGKITDLNLNRQI